MTVAAEQSPYWQDGFQARIEGKRQYPPHYNAERLEAMKRAKQWLRGWREADRQAIAAAKKGASDE